MSESLCITVGALKWNEEELETDGWVNLRTWENSGKARVPPHPHPHCYTKRVPIAWRLTSVPHKVIIVYLKSHDWVSPLFRSGLCIVSSNKYSPWYERKCLLTDRGAWFDSCVWALAWLQISRWKVRVSDQGTGQSTSQSWKNLLLSYVLSYDWWLTIPGRTWWTSPLMAIWEL